MLICVLWLIPEHKITPDDAEIPDPTVDPELHWIVISNMVHGPCGSINLTPPAWKTAAAVRATQSSLTLIPD